MEIERIREKVARRLVKRFPYYYPGKDGEVVGYDELPHRERMRALDDAKQFISEDGIRIECSNQDLPDDPYGWASSQQKMLTPDSKGNVWVKCLKKDKE